MNQAVCRFGRLADCLVERVQAMMSTTRDIEAEDTGVLI